MPTQLTQRIAAIATAIALSVGIYSLILGLLKLGFLLELVSIPVLTGYISAAALTVIVGQAPVIFGMELKGTVANKIRETFMSLPKTRGFDFAVGSISMVLLIGIQILGRRYGKTSKIAWIVSVGRNAIVIILASIVAFLAHPKHEQGESPTAFALTGTIPPGLRTSKAPDMTLVGRILPNAITVFVAAALEHFAVAKSFGRKNGYTIDQSQELTFLGFTNLFNSFLGGMAVSGAASRTAVNSESGVKSPLGGLFTAATVLISLYGLTGALYWIPKATLSAIIIVAVWSIIVPVSVFYGFWKVSFVDFLASQIAFWVTLFHSTQCGIMSATAFTLFITILRMMFSRGAVVRAGDVQRSYAGDGADDGAAGLGLQVGLETPPEGYQIIRFTTPIVFLNAAQTKASILHGVQTFHTGREIALEGADPNRLWNGLTARDVALLRKKAGLSAQDVELLPPIRVVVLDLERVMYVDTTGFRALEDAIAELEVYGGREAEVRIVGLRGELVGKLERSGVKLRKDDGENEGVLLFDGMEDALRAAIAPSEKKEQSALESESGVLEV